MRKSLTFIISGALLISCSKSSDTNSAPTNPVTSTPVTTPPVQAGTSKNYLQTSYELQKSEINIDLVSLRNSNNQTAAGFLAVAYLDINGDRKDDIFINPLLGSNNRATGEIYLYKNGNYVLDNSYFTTPPSLIHARKALVGDYNNDGMPDIFITGHGYDQPPFPGEYTELLLSNSSKKYDLIKFDTKIGFYHGACSGDIDKDGDLDIFVLAPSNSYFLINDGKGNFSISTSQIDITKLSGQYHCELVDIDKDGYLDLVIGGHDMEAYNKTQILWGSSSHKYDFSNKTEIPSVEYFGVVTDLDIADLDNDGINELAITRTGGKVINNSFSYFYQGWYIQIIKLSNRIASNVTLSFIEKNSKDYLVNNPWIIWMRFEDYDNNGKIDFFSTRCGGADFVRWELQNGKLIRIN